MNGIPEPIKASPWCRVMAVALVWSSASLALAAAPPFVAGFERLGRGAGAPDADAGRVLIANLNCTGCHALPSAGEILPPPNPAPVLAGASERLRPEFVSRWLASPHAVKPGTVMPDLLATYPEGERAEMVKALTSYVLRPSQGEPADPPPGNPERGRELFHRVGCVACHGPVGNYQLPGAEAASVAVKPLPGVPLGDLGGKYTRAGLTYFIENPLAVRPGGRMPRVPLTAQEAADVASFLMPEDSPVKVPFTDAAKVAQGEKLFRQLRCDACHQSERSDAQASAPAKPLMKLAASVGQGCLAEKPAAGLPDFAFDQAQRAAVGAALAAISKPLSAGQMTKLTLASFNCFACHERDSVGGPDAGRSVFFTTANGEDLGDEGRLPPRLTGVGAKLIEPATAKIISGNGAVRPYMATRMPDFGMEHATALASLLTRADEAKRLPAVEAVGRNAAGRTLIGTTGLGCISCHNLRGHKSLGVPAVDLANAPNRLRREWFHAYLLDPVRFRPGTRMPAFFPDGVAAGSKPGAKPSVKTAHTQIDALWVYLMEIDQSRLPEGMEAKGDFELKPQTAPIVFRTFMEGAGMHAIGVGYPQGLNVAFDADQVRWALAWKGRFLDAQGTWDDRAAPVAKPLGEALIKLPAGPAVASLESQTTPWPTATGKDALTMRGFRLDQQRVPTFLYASGNTMIEDRFVPEAAGKTLRRTMRVTELHGTLWVRLAAARQIVALADGAWRIENKLECRLNSPAPRDAVLRKSGAVQELIVPLTGDGGGTAQLEALFTW